MEAVQVTDLHATLNPPATVAPTKVVVEQQPIHVLVYGDPGGGKTTFATTFPTPILYFTFDAVGKEMPVLRLGKPGPLNDGVRQVLGKNGELVAQVEYFHDLLVNKPVAYQKFMARLASVSADMGKFKTLVLDSVTSMELAARKQQQYSVNPQSKDPRQWFAGTTERLEEVLCIWLGALHNINVVVCAHIDEDKDELHGTFVRNPAAPGRLRKRLAAYYAEMYRVYASRPDQSKPAKYLLQTRSNQLYNATSVVAEAPDPCDATYAALWASK